MSNPSKAKGTAFETAVVNYLRESGLPNVERRALHGNTDLGDVAGVPDWTFELKNRKTLDVGGAVDEAMLETLNAGTEFGVAIIKRPRRGNPADAFAVMPLFQLIWIIHALRYRTER
jgi:hypothetical protein